MANLAEKYETAANSPVSGPNFPIEAVSRTRARTSPTLSGVQYSRLFWAGIKEWAWV